MKAELQTGWLQLRLLLKLKRNVQDVTCEYTEAILVSVSEAEAIPEELVHQSLRIGSHC